MREFTGNLINNLKKYNVNEFIFYSLGVWHKFIEENDLMDKYIVEFLLDESNKDRIRKFVDKEGILNLKYSQNKITKRLIIGFDLYISIRKDLDINFRDYFKEYEEYLKTVDINNALKLKVLLYEIAQKVNLVPNLAMYDTMANAGTAVGYNIRYYNKQIAENIYIDIRCDIKLNLAVLSDKRNEKTLDLIEREIEDLENLLSNGLFNLIVFNNYPKSLEPILPEKTYRAQIENRVLKDQIEVKYLGKIYRAIELKDGYLALDRGLNAEEDRQKAKTIYCKASLAKSFL